MSELIESVQTQDPGSALIELFELDLGSTVVYMHSGVEEDLTTIEFRDKLFPYTVREYIAFPIMMDGIEASSDGASNRPSLSVANVLSSFSDSLGGLSNEDLVGKTIVRRQTLKKYLVGELGGNTTPPVEFPSKKYILDRVSSENSVAVTFELSAPFDLSGITIPRRTLVGKYCSWIYQGHFGGVGGGCTWALNSEIQTANASGGVNTHKAFFTQDDEPIVPEADVAATTALGHTGVKGYVTWDENDSYVVDNFVLHSDTVWKCVLANTGNTPEANSRYWLRGDVCGKKLSSCKARFQFRPNSFASSNSIPSVEKLTNQPLPFGAFSGSKKFR